MGIANHYFFRTVTFDYGNYNFAFWDYSQLRISSIPTYPGNFLQDHFSFTLFYFLPVYWLLNWLTGTYTLIIIQYSLISIAAWYTYKLVLLKTENTWLSSGVLIYYFVLLGRFTTFSCDVNLAVLSSCFIPIFIYYFEVKKYSIAFVVLILSLLSRENIPIWFVFIFAVLIIQHHKEKKAVLFSLLGIAISIGYFIVLFKVLIPSIESSEKQFTLFNYSALGANPGEALSFILKHPTETIKLFFVNHLNDPAFDGVKFEFYWVYLVSGGIILLLRPQYLIWFIPIVAQKVLNDSYIRWGISTYYSIEVVTLLPLSVFLALSSLKSRIVQNGLTILVCVATLAMTIHKLDRTNVVIPWTLNPSKEKFYYKRFYQSEFKLKETHKLLNQIPKEAKVSSSDHLLSHLAQRQFIYLFPEVKDAEYIVFSVFDDYFELSHMQNEKIRNNYLYNSEWEIIAEEFPVFLLKKKETGDIYSNETYTPIYKTDTLFCNFELIDTVKNVVVFDNGTKAEELKRVSTERYKDGTRSLKLDKESQYSTSITFNDIDQIRDIHASVWYFGENANIVTSCGSRFYFLSNTAEETHPSGWKKMELSFWVPQNLDLNKLVVYLWNSGSEPLYFDDFKIIKRYKN
jgi:uncharacterized membrane protein